MLPLRRLAKLGLVAEPELLLLRQLERPELLVPPVRIRQKLRPVQLVQLEKFLRPGLVLLLQWLGLGVRRMWPATLDGI